MWPVARGARAHRARDAPRDRVPAGRDGASENPPGSREARPADRARREIAQDRVMWLEHGLEERKISLQTPPAFIFHTTKIN